MPKPRIEKARDLRSNLSLPEGLLWRLLKGDALGYRFRRQHPIGNCTLDFYCPEVKLNVEIDGGSHYLRGEEDLARDSFLTTQKIHVMRIPAGDVLKSPSRVADQIKAVCDSLKRSSLSDDVAD